MTGKVKSLVRNGTVMAVGRCSFDTLMLLIHAANSLIHVDTLGSNLSRLRGTLATTYVLIDLSLIYTHT